MESPEEVVAFYSSSSSTAGGSGGSDDCQYNSTTFTKRKRTKRLRAFSSSPPKEEQEQEDYFSTTTTTTTITTTTTKEEEDTAHCLILLAQGARGALEDDDGKARLGSRKFAETATTAAGAKAGFYVYECKTCNKCFPSFQALGGHRASHKKPRLLPGPTEPAAVNKDHVDHHHVPTNIMNSNNNIKFRVHECSICGSEFSSGQALGGHMRRHRPAGPSSATAAAPESPESPTKKPQEKKSVVLLSLDLNLPAPSEETNSNISNNNNNSSMAIVAFAFADQLPMALVDCHY